MIPYDAITEAADRRWTFRLLERLLAPDLPDKEVDDLVAALQSVSDLRSVGPLDAVVCDTARPARIRTAASSVLRGMQHLVPRVPEATLRRWWREGDAVLRRHALLSMDAADCPDIVLGVARDPGHELHAEALGCMDFFFDLPEHEEIKIAALSHPEARVREVAAYVLLWDEPVRAEEPLIRATGDPVPEVAAEAANTLEYYPSLKTIRCLHGLLDHPADKVRAEARQSYDALRGELLSRLSLQDRRVTPHIRSWLRRVWDLLAFTDAELRPEEPEEEEGPAASRAQEQEVLPAIDLLALLAHPDASPRVLGDQLWNNNWRAVVGPERRQLRPVLLAHPDPLVRERATRALEAWQDADGLIDLVRDADRLVRKAAMYCLGQLPPTPGIADLAWEYLHRPSVLGVHASETLATFVRHADSAVAARRLAGIAADHGHREELRVAAVNHLEKLGAVDGIWQLMGLLQEPPTVTWALHIALLQAAADLGLTPPDLGPLQGVDNLHVQEAVARVATRGRAGE